MMETEHTFVSQEEHMEGLVERLLTADEAQELLGVSRATFWRIIYRGDLQAVRLSGNGRRGRILVDPVDLKDFIERCKKPVTNGAAREAA